MEERHAARRGAPTGADVLAAARAILRDEGPAGLSVRRVAEAVGTSRQVVYSRFGGKAGLVRALHDEAFTLLGDRVGSVAEAPGTDAHVVALGRAYRRVALDAPELFDVMFSRPFPEFTADADARAVAVASFRHIVEGAASWLRANGTDAAPAAAHRMARSLWSATHGVVSLERAGHLTDEQATEQLDDVLRRVLRGSEA
jgi:AcrR family transcriptional regulator